MRHDWDDFAGFEPYFVHAIRKLEIDAAEAKTDDRRLLTPEAMQELKEWAEQRNTKQGSD